jgi:hypothetical protein
MAPPLKVGARCGSSARRDLCGGRGVTRVPTATPLLGPGIAKASGRRTAANHRSALQHPHHTLAGEVAKPTWLRKVFHSSMGIGYEALTLVAAQITFTWSCRTASASWPHSGRYRKVLPLHLLT